MGIKRPRIGDRVLYRFGRLAHGIGVVDSVCLSPYGSQDYLIDDTNGESYYVNREDVRSLSEDDLLVYLFLKAAGCELPWELSKLEVVE